MKIFILKALLQKDLRNLRSSLGPALLLGVPVLLLLEFTKDEGSQISAISAFWIAYFLSSTSLFFRSFGFENRNRNFQIYTSFRIAPLAVFFSQALIHFFALSLLSATYLFLVTIFWSPIHFHGLQNLGIAVLVSLALCPVGSLLGLLLQLEREFLFSLFYLPLATPAILSGTELTQDWGQSWFDLLLGFFLISAFICSFFFDRFFNDLSQTS